MGTDLGQADRPEAGLPTRGRNSLLKLGRQPARLPPRRRGTIPQRLPAALLVAAPKLIPVARLAPPLAAANGGLRPASINATISQRDSHDNRFRRGRSIA
jgi:hypothetical protein